MQIFAYTLTINALTFSVDFRLNSHELKGWCHHNLEFSCSLLPNSHSEQNDV